MSDPCDECGLPIPVCNMNAMIDEAVRKCGLDVTVFTLRERFIDADTHQPKCVTHEAVSLADYAALLAEIAAMQSRAEAAELREKALLEGTEINRKTTLAHNASHARQIAAKDAEIALLREALNGFRLTTPGLMVAVMTLGRDGLILADNLHKADDAARAALKGDSHE